MSPRRMGKTGLIKNAFYQIHQENPEAAVSVISAFCDRVSSFPTTVWPKRMIKSFKQVVEKMSI